MNSYLTYIMIKYAQLLKKLANMKNVPTNKILTSKSVRKFVSSKRFKRKFNYGNLEFGFFALCVTYGLYYISKHRFEMSETTRLIGAGITTHIVVDVITYLGDRINTKVKVESFKPKKELINFNELTTLFNQKFLHFKEGNLVKRSVASQSLGSYMSDLKFRGIQAAMVFVTLNSILFYGLYKNVKHYLKEKLCITGFLNFFLSAAFAQLIAMTFAFPLENIKTRMQASTFTYDSFYKYYKKLIVNNPWSVIYKNMKEEYSGFVSHLVLYVVYESLTFGIYETMMKMERFKPKKEEKPDSQLVNSHNDEDEGHHDVNMWVVLFAGSVSGIISAILTNPIDVYQINKQMNPNFSMSLLNRQNILAGIRERILFITFLNITTFLFLETIGPKYFKIRLE